MYMSSIENNFSISFKFFSEIYFAAHNFVSHHFLINVCHFRYIFISFNVFYTVEFPESFWYQEEIKNLSCPTCPGRFISIYSSSVQNAQKVLFFQTNPSTAVKGAFYYKLSPV